MCFAMEAKKEWDELPEDIFPRATHPKFETIPDNIRVYS